MTDDKGLFSRAHLAVTGKYLPGQEGKTFTSDDVMRFFGPRMDTDYRVAINQVLYYLSDKSGKLKDPVLQQAGNRYRLIQKETNELKWWEVGEDHPLDLVWPYGMDDNSSFGLEEVKIYAGSPIVVAGVSNMGKSLWCLNFMLLNMSNFPCLYMTSEWSAEQLASRIRNFSWVTREDMMNGDGSPKFKVIKRYDNFADVVQPDAINIIDYARIDEKSYLIGQLINSIKQKLGKGIAVIAIQKDKNRELARGGSSSLDDAQLYLAIDYERLTIVKAKSYKEHNPNGKKYSFRIVSHGSQFHDIQEVTE